MTRLFMPFLLLFMPPAAKYHAFELFSGKGFTDLESVQYSPCSSTVSFSPSTFAFDRESYTIDYTEKFADTLLSYFGHRMKGSQRVQCSFIALPPEPGKSWTLLFTWQDSLKAFHAKVLTWN